jgi:hypothetical protein
MHSQDLWDYPPISAVTGVIIGAEGWDGQKEQADGDILQKGDSLQDCSEM